MSCGTFGRARGDHRHDEEWGGDDLGILGGVLGKEVNDVEERTVSPGPHVHSRRTVGVSTGVREGR